MKKIKEKFGSEVIGAVKFYSPIAFIIFYFSFLVGIIFVALNPEASTNYLTRVVEELSFLTSLNTLQLGVFIFLNNLVKTFLFMIMGVLFVVPTVLFLVINGLVLGIVVAISYPQLGVGGLFHSLFFHGIFELTAVFMGSGLGLWLGISSFDILKKKKKSLQNIFSVMEIQIKKSCYFFIYLILPLILVAAIIETAMIFFL